jgi:hypothetical protein
MLTTLASDNKYPSIGVSRTDVNGGTVISAQVLGSDDKYLRIDRTLLAADQLGYITADAAKYIGEKEYIVETDFRFSCDAGFGITPVTIIGEKSETQFIPVEVKGAYNTLTMNMRGVRYDLYNSAGQLLKVKTVDDSEFTKLAVLVNENDLTYTVYVDERIAYYYYDGEYLPCAGIPMTFSETEISTKAGASLKLMAIDSIKHNYSIIDIDRIAIIPTHSGLSSEFKATQSRVDLANQLFDLRFIAGVDSLYGNNVGFDVEATYTDGTTKTVKKTLTSSTVISSVINENVTIEASEFNSAYLSVMSVTSLPVTTDGVEFKITPFVEYGGIRANGEAVTFTATFENDKVVIE